MCPHLNQSRWNGRRRWSLNSTDRWEELGIGTGGDQNEQTLPPRKAPVSAAMMVLMEMIVARSPTVHWAWPPSNTGQLAASSGPNQNSSTLILQPWTNLQHIHKYPVSYTFTKVEPQQCEVLGLSHEMTESGIQRHGTKFTVFAKTPKHRSKPSWLSKRWTLLA